MIDCSALRVQHSVARGPVHPSAATTNAALAGELDDVPLGTPEEAPALLQARFYIIPTANIQKTNAFISISYLLSVRFKIDDFPSGWCFSAAARAPASADEKRITPVSQVKHKPGKFDLPSRLLR
jgi:hypothetical protein